VGWCLVPDDLRDAVLGLGGNFSICPPAPAQYAAVAAFAAYPELDGHVARYAANRRLMLDRLAGLGFDRVAPADGAFYVYADVSHLTDDAEAWCRRLLAQQGLAIAPGIDFDPGGIPSIRFSFAGNAATIEGGLDALERFLR
jgi:aspartate/methionine/tyrosine aminotransferase